MTKMAYGLDLLTRSFFIFLVVYLLARRWWIALLVTVALNLVFELIWGRKRWQQWRQAPRRPRRTWRQVGQQLWTRLRDRKRTKGLVLAGIVILMMSWVVPFNVYYLSVACVVFGLAAISRFAPPAKSVTIKHESESDPSPGPTDCPPVAT